MKTSNIFQIKAENSGALRLGVKGSPSHGLRCNTPNPSAFAGYYEYQGCNYTFCNTKDTPYERIFCEPYKYIPYPTSKMAGIVIYAIENQNANLSGFFIVLDAVKQFSFNNSFTQFTS